MWFAKPSVGTPLDWENPLNKGTLLAFAMNEGHGDKVQDLSMNGHHGKLNPGQTGIVPTMDGVDDHIDCGNNYNLTDAITVSALINTSAQGQQIISKHSAIGPFYFQTSGDTSLRFMTYTTAGRVNHDATCVYKGGWHSVVGVYDAAIGKSKIYLDGNMIGVPAAQTGLLRTSTANVFLGTYGESAAAGNYFEGQIDQPRIQSRAWSAKEVKDYAINPWQVYLDEDD